MNELEKYRVKMIRVLNECGYKTANLHGFSNDVLLMMVFKEIEIKNQLIDEYKKGT